MEAEAPKTTPALYWFTVGLGYAMALGLGVFAGANASEGVGDPLASIALAVVYAQPAILATLAPRDRWVMLVAAFWMTFALVFGTFNILAVSFLIPAAMYLQFYGRVRPKPRPQAFAGIHAMVGILCGLAPYYAAFIHEDPRCELGTTGGGCTSNTVSGVELLLVCVLVAAGVLVIRHLGAPRKADPKL